MKAVEQHHSIPLLENARILRVCLLQIANPVFDLWIRLQLPPELLRTKKEQRTQTQHKDQSHSILARPMRVQIGGGMHSTRPIDDDWHHIA